MKMYFFFTIKLQTNSSVRQMKVESSVRIELNNFTIPHTVSNREKKRRDFQMNKMKLCFSMSPHIQPVPHTHNSVSSTVSIVVRLDLCCSYISFVQFEYISHSFSLTPSPPLDLVKDQLLCMCLHDQTA